MDKLLHKSIRWVKKNYLLSFVALITCFVMAVAIYKLYIAKPVYVYARVRVGQGLWWASTNRPAPWFIEAMQEARDKKILGKPPAQIVSLTYYPWYGSGQYEVIMILKLKVSRSGEAGYSYNRSTLGVGAPIDLEFSNVQFSGTVMSLSSRPINSPYVEKKVTFTKKSAYPWEAEAIPVGDTYFNGETTTLRILDKQAVDTYSINSDSLGNSATEMRKYITVTAMLKGKMENGQFVYFGEQVVTPGKPISVASNNFVFNDFTVEKVE